MAKLQLVMGGQVQQTTGLKSVGFDWRNEIQRSMEDQKFQAEQQALLLTAMDTVGISSGGTGATTATRTAATYSKPVFPQPQDRGFAKKVDHRGKML